jgi:hypothetical protein
MKMRAVRLLSPARILGVLLAGAALSAHAAATVTLVFTNAPSGTYSNGVPVVVQAVATPSGLPDPATNTAMTLWFRTLAPLCTNLWNAVPMASNGLPANVWQATVPRLPAGTVDYYVTCDFSGTGAVSPTSTVTSSYTVGTLLPAARYADFQDTWTGTPYVYSNAARWITANSFAPGDYAAFSHVGTIWVTGGKFCFLLNTNTPKYVMSPLLSDGVARVSFDVCLMKGSGGWTNSVALETSVDTGATWQVQYSASLTAGTPLYPTVTVTGVTGPSLVRVRGTGYTAGAGDNCDVVIDNIRLVPLAADLVLAAATNAVTPDTPESYDAVTLRCLAADVNPLSPSVNRRVTAWYNYTDINGVAAGWASLPMTNSPSAPFEYSAVLTNAAGQGLDAGTNQYYFTCDFDGYYYSDADKRASIASATNTYAINFANVKVLQLGTNALDFGGVATNATGVRAVPVHNSGNVPLSVTNVDCPAPFSVSTPLPLVVPAGGTSNLMVSFAPAVLGSTNSTLTVWSDATSVTGTNTVSLTGTGLVAETTAMVSLNGPAGGLKNTPLAFTASASNNYGHAVQFQFDWGDDSSLIWGTSVVSMATFVTNHTWTATNTFSVKTRARCAADVNVTSAWYGPVTITITNTRVIRLVGNLPGKLDFGSVLTNSTVNLPLQVCNDGVDTLNVTNVTVVPGAGFSVSPTSFTVPWGSGTNVTVYFTPTVTNPPYIVALTVLSDAMGGTNTIQVAGTGTVTEAVFTPTLNGATNGAPGQTLSFWAQTTDNYGSNIQYRFDWGDGSTSSWGSVVASGTIYTNTHFWTNEATYQVKAQAQNYSGIYTSPWSAPLSVGINFSRVIGVNGDLAFGIAVTNIGSAPQVLTVTNSGSGPLSVAAITGTPAFAVAPTNAFTLPAGAGTNLNVTFLPSAVGAHTGLLTVVSDKTAGTNTIAVSGTGVVWRGVNSLAGPATGTRGDALTYTATPAASWSVETLEYQFDWGDGQTSLWQAAASTSHVWTAVSTNTLRARVRSAWHTNVFSTWTVRTNIVYDQPQVIFGPGTNGLPLPVAATISAPAGTVSNVALGYQAPGSASTNFVLLPLAAAGAATWTNMLPPLSPGTLNYILQYLQAGTAVRYPSSGSLSTNLTGTLGAVRQEAFDGTWTHLGGNQYVNAAGWTGSYMAVGSIIGLNTDPNLPPTSPPSGKYLVLLNTNQPCFLMTPLLPQGIGTIYFEAVLRKASTF